MREAHDYLVLICSVHRLAFVPSNQDYWLALSPEAWEGALEELMETPRTLIVEVACPHCHVVKGEA